MMRPAPEMQRTARDRPGERAAPPAEADAPLQQHRTLVDGLRGALEVDGMPVDLIETHISSVLVHRGEAWKLKKPVALGFLDFSSAEARGFFCTEELRLNRRLAPDLYLDVVPVTGTIASPRLGGPGAAIDHAVHMRAFAQQQLAHAVLARGELTAGAIDALAEQLARFHEATPAAPAEGPFGAPDVILQYALDNVAEMRTMLHDPRELDELGKIEAWTRHEHALRREFMQHRRETGFIRECHGDLHLGNIVILDGRPVIFDCIEFNAELRWIDVMSEVAFLVMDLHDRGHPAYAHRFLDAYLERTGDHAGLGVLRFYLVYRAMVRAKVACLRARQLATGPARNAADREYHEYFALARHFVHASHPALLVTHGYAGSGKSTWTSVLLEHAGAVRIRTDVERKRLAGLPREARSGSGLGGGLYSEDGTRATYARVADLAALAAGAGFVAIADGTFLARWQRDLLRQRAAAIGVPFAILDFTASRPTLEARILLRQHDDREVSEAGPDVLALQIERADPLGQDEHEAVVSVDTEAAAPARCVATLWQTIAGRLGIPAVSAEADAR